ncbi:hypothetical protein tinsulaeT_22920 [Thalassotalea insulae]|uniref:GGDEF domain-containing response regulator n=1 Tax=Thalassotalea insulae TaxID=2056778 RepID=A0ABQ6GUD8_9GAMM|nr:EAL domain-containing protein [Thalassotalea insulae]GLX78952.1 hypothetical protein tinsulaeT_22920 [Thalassotalea insulae]
MNTSDLKLLVVDDDDVDREKIRRLLKLVDLPASIEEASSVKDSIAVIKNSDYDCIIVDYRLGNEDGLKLLNQIRTQLDKNCAVIIITGLGSEEVAAEAMRLGASDYLIKNHLKATQLLHAILNAISKAKYEQEINELAHFDNLTGLVSRPLLLDRLRQTIKHIERQEKLAALAFIDLDHFKPINDNHGHDAGDFVLVEIAKKLTYTLRTSDTIARIGGDEFVLLLDDINDIEECEDLLKRVLLILSVPIQLPNESFVKISASIGVTIIHDAKLDADTILRRADQTMYQAKNSGRNKISFFDPEEEKKQVQLRKLLTEVGAAIDSKQFNLLYQPKINSITNEFIGVEALIRWHHPEQGVLSPSYFSHALEHSAMGIKIGEWVINHALKQCALWRKAGYNIQVSINITPAHILKRDFIDRLHESLIDYPKSIYSLLEIEVLESVSIANIDEAVEVLSKCQALGINIALDDFGTGFASLNYLKQLPLNTLKVDRAFIQNIKTDKKDEAIVKSIIGLSKDFNYRLIAEGIETKAQLKKFQSLGGEIVQGYYYAKPMAADKLIPWIIAKNFRYNK